MTIAGQPFAHLLYHFTLMYSNWEWGQVLPELLVPEQAVTSQAVRTQMVARSTAALCSVPGVFLPLLELSAYDGLLTEVAA